MADGSGMDSLFKKASDFYRSGAFVSAVPLTEGGRDLSVTLYGLYKQATVGKCDTPQPSYFDFVGHKRWQAWKDFGDMPPATAKAHYVSIFDQRCPSWAGPERENALRQMDVGAAEEDTVHHAYFITGATGFLGKHLLAAMLKRNKDARFYCLAFESDEVFKDIFTTRFGDDAERIVRVPGDITKRTLGLSEEQMSFLKDEAKVTIAFHLAAMYNLRASEDVNHQLNVNGTTYAVDVANALGAEFHYVSTVVISGDYQGTFMETMYDEGQTHTNPYYKTKFDAEGIVRKLCAVPFSIYRPGIVIGSSETGEADKIDGPYYLFDTIRHIRRHVPEWMVLMGVRGQKIPLVPVDYVTKAMDVIAHRRGCRGKTFHLVDPAPFTFIETANIFSHAAHAPQYSTRITDTVLGLIPGGGFKALATKYPKAMQWPMDLLSALTNVPQDAFSYAFLSVRYDDSATRAALRDAGSNLRCPPLDTYAWKVWDHYERVMVPMMAERTAMANEVRGRVVVVTGGDSGIGWACTLKLAKAGARLVLVSFGTEELQRAKSTLEEQVPSVDVRTFYCNLAKEDESTALPARILEEVGCVDIVINCAGRSIRRSVIYATDRFHDFKRTMDINYYGSVAMILGFLNHMRENKYGRIINVSSIGAQTYQPRFSAYAASKAALDAFSRCLNSEVAHENVQLHTVYMPLVKTKMIAPTAKLDRRAGFNYYNMVAITPEQAADMVLSPLTNGYVTVSTQMGSVLQAIYYVAPQITHRVFNYMYRIEPETPPEGMAPTTDKQLYVETMALTNLFAGLEM